MSKIISVTNHKGGVGKTTTVLTLGHALALLDKRVLLVDFDPQMNLSQTLEKANWDKTNLHDLQAKHITICLPEYIFGFTGK